MSRSLTFYIYLSTKEGVRKGEIQHMEISTMSEPSVSYLLHEVSLALSMYVMIIPEADVQCLYNTRTRHKILSILDVLDEDVVIATQVCIV